MMKKVPAQSVGASLGRTSRTENGRHPTGTGYVYIFNGMKHREKGPAEIRNDGYQAWYYKGKKHRIDGPAVSYPDGRQEFWLEGVMTRAVDPNKVAPGTKVDLRKMPH